MKPVIITITTRDINQNGYIIIGANNEAVIIDPGFDAERYNAELDSQAVSVRGIFATHGHFDHIAAVSELVDTHGVEFAIHEDDILTLNRANTFAGFLNNAEKILIPQPSNILRGKMGSIKFNSFQVDWFHSPGHTPGSVCFLIGNNIFTGDLILPKSHFSSKLPGASKHDLDKSLSSLLLRNGELNAFPGHGKAKTLNDLLGSVVLS